MDKKEMLVDNSEQYEQLAKLIAKKNGWCKAGVGCGTVGGASILWTIINFVSNGSPVVQGISVGLAILFSLLTVYCVWRYVEFKNLQGRQELEIKVEQKRQELELDAEWKKKEFELKELYIRQELELDAECKRKKLELEEKNDSENQAHKRVMDLLEHEYKSKKEEHEFQLKKEFIEGIQKNPELLSVRQDIVSQEMSNIIDAEYITCLNGTTNNKADVENTKSGKIIQMPRKE